MPDLDDPEQDATEGRGADGASAEGRDASAAGARDASGGDSSAGDSAARDADGARETAAASDARAGDAVAGAGNASAGGFGAADRATNDRAAASNDAASSNTDGRLADRSTLRINPAGSSHADTADLHSTQPASTQPDSPATDAPAADSVVAGTAGTAGTVGSKADTARRKVSTGSAINTAPDTRRRTRGVLLVSARAVTGLIGLAATAATVLAATILPLPSYVATPPEASVIPVPAAQQRACAGPMLRLGDDTGASATVASAVGSPQVRHLATGGTVDESQIEQTDEPSGRSATVLTLEPDAAGADLQPLLSGGQVQTVSFGDLAGLAAAECVEPRAETWLVGGSTDTGRTTLLTLANPGTVAATVGITIYSEEGAVDAPGTQGIVVQPGSEVSYPLAGFAPGLLTPVVHVASVGGSVVANLQQTTVRILKPGGLDIVGPAAVPSTEVVIPGLVVRGHEQVEEFEGAEGYQDIMPVLRLFVPGDLPASVAITVIPDDGGAPIGVDFDLPAGKVSEFPFEHYEDGNYTVTVSSDVPLVAGARVTVVEKSGASDFAWLESAETMRKQVLVSVGSRPDAVLHLANTTGADAVVTIEADDTPPDTVTVPAGGAVTVPTERSTSYRLGGFEALRVAVGYAGTGLISGFTVSPTGPVATPITVYP